MQYHGIKPVSKSDFKMAKDHLKQTFKLNKDKIKDHQKALKDAQSNNDSKSAAYNKSHLTNHQADNQKVQQSMKTVNKLKPAVIMPVKKSSGLSNYVKKNKTMAQAIGSK